MTVIMTIIAILIYMLIKNLIQKKVGNKKTKFNQIPVGYFIGASNIIILFMMTFITNCCI